MSTFNSQWQITGPATVTFRVAAPLFCPYFNSDERGQGSIDYFQHRPFVHHPFTLPAFGCSGSPVIVDHEGRFYGFLNYAGIHQSTFAFDSYTELTVNVPEGQALFVDESGDAGRAWRRYNSEVMRRLGMKPLGDVPAFWHDLEYCTWVEQGYMAREAGTKAVPVHTHDVLTHDWVEGFIRQIKDLGYPPGKLTLDHGWGTGSRGRGFGSWTPDPAKFPDFRRTAAYIAEQGFTPGIWIGFPKIHPYSDAARRFPDLVGSVSPVIGEDKAVPPMHYLADRPGLADYSRETIARFHDMGFRKFKIDMSYSYKHEMIAVHRAIYRVAKEIDPSVEMEFHVPDIFAMQYGDVIRTNDIWITPYMPWRELTQVRYDVCINSSAGRILNRDHIGGNHHIYVNEENYLQHLDTYHHGVGYPVVSLLPHHLGARCVEATGELLWAYHKGPKKTVSEVYDRS